MKTKITDLREHLFAQLEALGDTDKPLEETIKRAKAVSEVAKTIIDSARVEVDAMKVTGKISGSGFMPLAAADEPERPALPPVRN